MQNQEIFSNIQGIARKNVTDVERQRTFVEQIWNEK
jgi:hypothetical protein